MPARMDRDPSSGWGPGLGSSRPDRSRRTGTRVPRARTALLAPLLALGCAGCGLFGDDSTTWVADGTCVRHVHQRREPGGGDGDDGSAGCAHPTAVPACDHAVEAGRADGAGRRSPRAHAALHLPVRLRRPTRSPHRRAASGSGRCRLAHQRLQTVLERWYQHARLPDLGRSSTDRGADACCRHPGARAPRRGVGSPTQHLPWACRRPTATCASA